MCERISADEALENEGLTLNEVVFESVIPACCSEGCQVEPDGVCEHGHPSVLLDMMLI